MSCYREVSSFQGQIYSIFGTQQSDLITEVSHISGVSFKRGSTVVLQAKDITLN